MISGQWFYRRIFLRIDQKLHKITPNSMKNRGSTPILTNLVGVHPRNIHIKFESNPCSCSGEEVKKPKRVHAAAADNDDGHRVIARVTLTRV